MIISASRRTDIPSYYSDRFIARVKEGHVLTRNPVNPRQTRRISLLPEDVDGIVFWTKNPAPMLGKLGELKDFMYYFQFTLTPYGKDIEPNIPDKFPYLTDAFKRLSDLIGADRVIWRYDPIILNGRYSPGFHINAFGGIADCLRGYARRCVISFIDAGYRGVKRNMKELSLTEVSDEIKFKLCAELAETARSRGFDISACAEGCDLARLGIGRARCIDGELLSALLGRGVAVKKDRNQRPLCGCAASVDVGAYNTCPSGCLYCYANYACFSTPPSNSAILS